jgi:predicted kinase
MLALTIGLPGSGKSTLYKNLALSHERFPIVRPDSIREQFGVSFEERIEEYVWSIARAFVDGYFTLGKSVYLDATNLMPAWRSTWIDIAKQYDVAVLAIYFSLPFTQIKEQNARRQAPWVVPEPILLEMKNQLTPPSYEEGFHEIVTVKDAADPRDIAAVKAAIASLAQ